MFIHPFINLSPNPLHDLQSFDVHNPFNVQQHYYVTKHLPSTLAVEEDIRNIGQINFGFLRDAYRQPAFENRYLEPENMSIVRGRDAESQAFMTPDNSEAEIVAQ